MRMDIYTVKLILYYLHLDDNNLLNTNYNLKLFMQRSAHVFSLSYDAWKT